MPWFQSGGKISPAILFIIVILAVVFFISGLLHLIVRFLMKRRPSLGSQSNSRYPDMSSSGAFQRQLQQLFHLHDSGLDQAFIDALPVFLYQDLMGLKEPFDCAVCLCEFSEQDKLRLLPLCGHAFHIDCIDTWLLSNSTCPLCRGSLFTPEFSIENPIFEFDDPRDEDGVSGNLNAASAPPCGPKVAETNNNSIVNSKRVFSVRLGKFRNTNDGGRTADIEVGETSNSNLGARRCYSMGSYQYVVANTELQVSALHPGSRTKGQTLDARLLIGRGGLNGNSLNDGEADGKKLNIRSKGESFSVSKVWLWSNKDKFSSSTENQISSSVNVSLPWTPRTNIITTTRHS